MQIAELMCTLVTTSHTPGHGKMRLRDFGQVQCTWQTAAIAVLLVRLDPALYAPAAAACTEPTRGVSLDLARLPVECRTNLGAGTLPTMGPVSMGLVGMGPVGMGPSAHCMQCELQAEWVEGGLTQDLIDEGWYCGLCWFECSYPHWSLCSAF